MLTPLIHPSSCYSEKSRISRERWYQSDTSSRGRECPGASCTKNQWELYEEIGKKRRATFGRKGSSCEEQSPGRSFSCLAGNYLQFWHWIISIGSCWFWWKLDSNPRKSGSEPFGGLRLWVCVWVLVLFVWFWFCGFFVCCFFGLFFVGFFFFRKAVK